MNVSLNPLTFLPVFFLQLTPEKATNQYYLVVQILKLKEKIMYAFKSFFKKITIKKFAVTTIKWMDLLSRKLYVVVNQQKSSEMRKMYKNS